MAGTWTPSSEPIRPGLYLRFTQAAAAQVTGGPRGIVAIPLKSFTGTAEAEKVYTITREAEAAELFGSANIQSIKFALQGGAAQVLVYTLAGTEPDDYTAAFNALEVYDFNVFVFDGEVEDSVQDSALTWLRANRDEGKNFIIVFGGNDLSDQDPAQGNSRSTRLEDEAAVNLITGVVIGNNSYTSSEYAPYIAGLIAGTPINRSITYANARVDDVTKRLRNSEITTALESGSLVLVSEGDRVRIEQGITTSGDKIRIVRAKQAITDDLIRTAARSYIGKIDNNRDGQAALIAAILAYLETLENENVLIDPTVQLDPNFESTGDKVYLLISFGMVDSIERIFLTINI